MENTIIQPPPFNKIQEQDNETQEPLRLEAMGLDEKTKKHIQELILNAETKGYLRGRNENIEATQHFDPDLELEPHPTGIPLYNRRSVWD